MKYEHELATQLFARRIALRPDCSSAAAILATDACALLSLADEEVARLEALVLVQATELRTSRRGG